MTDSKKEINEERKEKVPELSQVPNCGRSRVVTNDETKIERSLFESKTSLIEKDEEWEALESEVATFYLYHFHRKSTGTACRMRLVSYCDEEGYLEYTYLCRICGIEITVFPHYQGSSDEVLELKGQR